MPRLPIGPANIAPPLRCERLEDRSVPAVFHLPVELHATPIESVTIEPDYPVVLTGPSSLPAEAIPGECDDHCEEWVEDGSVVRPMFDENGCVVGYWVDNPIFDGQDPRYPPFWNIIDGVDWGAEGTGTDGSEDVVEVVAEDLGEFIDDGWYEEEWYEEEWYENEWVEEEWYEEGLYYDEGISESGWNTEDEFVDSDGMTQEKYEDVWLGWDRSEVLPAPTPGDETETDWSWMQGDFEDGMVYTMTLTGGIALLDTPAVTTIAVTFELIPLPGPTSETDAGGAVAPALPPAATTTDPLPLLDVTAPQHAGSVEVSPVPMLGQPESDETAATTFAPPTESDDHLTEEGSLELSEDLPVG